MTDTPITRVAILADTHGFLDPRISERVAECDHAVHAGDVGGADVLCALNPSTSVVAIRGNNDTPSKWVESESHFLENLPSLAQLDLPGGRLVVTHGDDGRSLTERHRHLRKQYPQARAVVYGHSHKLTMDCDETPWILNPGAAGRIRTQAQGGPSCLLLKCTESEWDVEAVQLPARRYPNRDSQRRRSQAAD